jgi:hypothetical protein
VTDTLSQNRDVLVIPCWRRPEFLWHCLDNLRRAEGIGELHVLFRPDRAAARHLRDRYTGALSVSTQSAERQRTGGLSARRR